MVGNPKAAASDPNALALSIRDDRTKTDGRAFKSRRFATVSRVFRRPAAFIGAICAIIVVGMALSANLLPIAEPNTMDPLSRRLSPGSDGHLLGTDSFGRDLLSRSIHGAQISLMMAISVVFMGTVIGTTIGTFAGFRGGYIDAAITRIWDVMLSFPGLLLLIVVVGVTGPGVGPAIFALTLAEIPVCGRLVRERVLVQREQLFVEAAKVNGASESYIMFRHVLPNSLTPVLVLAALAVPNVILAEAALSYLGLGVPPPTASWGKMISEGQGAIMFAPWESLIPGACILLATLGFNLVADALRDVLDPSSMNR